MNLKIKKSRSFLTQALLIVGEGFFYYFPIFHLLNVLSPNYKIKLGKWKLVTSFFIAIAFFLFLHNKFIFSLHHSKKKKKFFVLIFIIFVIFPTTRQKSNKKFFIIPHHFSFSLINMKHYLKNTKKKLSPLIHIIYEI